MEGLADLRIIEAIMQSMKSGKVSKMKAFGVPKRPSEKQRIELGAIKKPNVVHVESPSGER
jgi:hypothetical protein